MWAFVAKGHSPGKERKLKLSFWLAGEPMRPFSSRASSQALPDEEEDDGMAAVMCGSALTATTSSK